MNPIVLTSKATLSYPGAASVGSGVWRVAFDQERLTNVYRAPIEVRAIRIFTRSQRQTRATSVNIAANFATTLKLKLGRHELTDGDILIAAMTPAKFSEIDSFRVPIPASAVEDDFRVGMQIVNLRKPIIMAPGVGIQAELALSLLELAIAGILSPYYLDCYISLVGRLLDEGAPVPREQELPTWSQVKIDTSTFVSGEDEIKNPCDKPLRVSRIVAIPAQCLQVGPGDIGVNWFLSLMAERLKITFPDNTSAAEGGPIRFDRLQFDSRNAWTTDFVMPANSRLRLNGTGFDLTASSWVYTVALFGTRSEVIG